MPIFLGGGHRQRAPLPEMQGTSANGQDRSSSDSMQVVFIDQQCDPICDTSEEQSVASKLPQPTIVSVAHARLAATALNLTAEADEQKAAEADGDQAGHALMFGRYMGQISARVERAWMRPRSVPLDGRAFACRVQITQDARGNVQEVTLQKCTSDPGWQLSLVHAITGASPLPAPPDPAVFSNMLTLEFDSDPYVAGGSDEGFQPLPPARVNSAAQLESSPAQPGSGTVTRSIRPDGSVDLRIVGAASRN